MHAYSLLTFVSLAIASRAAPSYGRGSSVAGAVYFLTNDPSGNKIVTIPIQSNGLLGPTVKGISTGALGLPGLTTPAGEPDTIFSQGSVTVHEKTKLLAAVNPGSNSISLFSINAEDPTVLTRIGRPVPSGGEYPQSIAFNSKGTEACVLNGGKVNGVNCFTVHPITGLTPKPNTLRLLPVNQTTPPSGPFNTVSSVFWSPDDSEVLALVKGVPTEPGSGYLATWSVGSDGSLSREYVKGESAPGVIAPFSFTPIPGANAYLSADAGFGVDVFSYPPSKGKTKNLKSTSTVTKIPGQVASCWSAYSPKSGNFYTTDTGTNLVTEFHVDKSLKPSIVKQYQLPGKFGILDEQVVAVGRSDFLYVLSTVETSVEVLSVNTPGNALHLQSFNFTSGAQKDNIKFTVINLVGLATFIKS